MLWYVEQNVKKKVYLFFFLFKYDALLILVDIFWEFVTQQLK